MLLTAYDHYCLSPDRRWQTISDYTVMFTFENNVKNNPCTAMPVIIQFQANYTDIVEFRGRWSVNQIIQF